MAVSPDGKHAYVTGSGRVLVIDTNTNRVVGSVTVSDAPGSAAVIAMPPPPPVGPSRMSRTVATTRSR